MATKKPIGRQTGTPARKKVPVKDDLLISPQIVQKYHDMFSNVHGHDVDRFSKESLDWFRNRITKDVKVNQYRLIDQQYYRKKTGTENSQLIGKMYFFHYKAEMAGDADLPIYDEFPMVFLFNSQRTKVGKTIVKGLNFHYLAPQARQQLLTALLKVRSTKAMLPNTRLRISWDIIRAAANSRHYEAAVHAYRIDRFKSRMIEIPANDWGVVTFLNLQNFVHIGDGKGLTPSGYRRKIRQRFQ